MIRVFVILFSLVACDTAGPHFGGLPATRVRVGEMIFDVRVRGDLAEAIRINTQWAPRLSGVQGPAALAMAHVSGCRVAEIRGDQALMLGLLDCGGADRAEPERPVSLEFDCHEVDRWRVDGLNQKTVVHDCDPRL